MREVEGWRENGVLGKQGFSRKWIGGKEESELGIDR